MQESQQAEIMQEDKKPDEDGTVLIYGFLQIKDADTGEVLLTTRA